MSKNAKKKKGSAPKKPEKRSHTGLILGIALALAAVTLAAVLLLRGRSGRSTLHHVELEVQNYGTITMELDASAAPKTVENFLKLAGSGFYDGLTFHRIIDGFMIQGGDPRGDGTGGSDETVVGEFAENGVENPISHVRGTVSMARSSDKNSASSQFFIVQTDSTYLDGQYAAFGHVTDGMDIVDAICKNTRTTDRNGTVAPENQPVITAVRVLD